MKLTTAELREIFDAIMRHLEASGSRTVAIEEDYYWVVPEEQRYDMEKDPESFSIGQLSEDIENLRGILDGRKRPLAYDLVWFSAILTRVGETTTP